MFFSKKTPNRILFVSKTRALFRRPFPPPEHDSLPLPARVRTAQGSCPVLRAHYATSPYSKPKWRVTGSASLDALREGVNRPPESLYNEIFPDSL